MYIILYAFCVTICTFVRVKQVEQVEQVPLSLLYEPLPVEAGVDRFARSSSGVSICTFVLEKHAKWGPGSRGGRRPF